MMGGVVMLAVALLGVCVGMYVERTPKRAVVQRFVQLDDRQWKRWEAYRQLLGVLESGQKRKFRLSRNAKLKS